MVCNKNGVKKTKEEEVTTNTVQIMHSTTLNFRAQVKADIEVNEMKGILERVPAGEPDSWCSRL